MKNVLIVSGHTDTVSDSVVNRSVLDILAEQLPDARIDYLDRLYPDFKIDAAAEQEKLLWADVVVLQFPVFWFSFPSIMHRWMEQTFLHGFSHGASGDKLRGKKLILSYTSGAPADAMSFEPFFEFVRAACGFTGMEYAGSIHTGGVSYHMRQDPALLLEMKEKSRAHAEKLLAMLQDA